MPRQITLADIDRAHRLFSTSHALAILNGLSQGRQPRDVVPPDAGQQAVIDALALLERMDLVRAEPLSGTSDSNRPVILTTRGVNLMRVLDDIAHDRDPEPPPK